MDAEQAWQDFKKSNETSVEDKLDVILAQQQEILTDTSRVADLVPLVTGDKAEEDALEEEGIDPEQGADPMTEETPGEEVPMDESPDGEEPTEDDGDNPFAFLDEEPGEGEDIEGGDYEETDEESDMVDATDDESDIAEDFEEGNGNADEGDEGAEADEYADEDSDEPVSGESDEDEGEYDGKPEEGSYISFDELDESDEGEPEEDKAKKSRSIPTTRTIKSIGARTPYKVVSKVQKPTPDTTYGRASRADDIADMLTKSQSREFDIGFGVDPHEVTKQDWADYRMMKRLNQF